MALTKQETNGYNLCESVVGVELTMHDALPLYRALDETLWRSDYDTYLEVTGTDGRVWQVAQCKPRRVTCTPGSVLAMRGVHHEYTLELAYDKPDRIEKGADGVTTIQYRQVTMYNDEIAHARICVY